MGESKNITWHASEVTKDERLQRNQHKSAVIWFTGLSGSGKSTISVELEKHYLTIKSIHIVWMEIMLGMD